MKEIKRFENREAAARDEKINFTLLRAYWDSREDENELLDFNDVIWDQDIEQISETLREEGITQFTISSTFSGLIETLAAFEKVGFKMQGLTTVNARYKDWKTDEYKKLPAILMERK